LKFLEDGSFENDFTVYKNTHDFPNEDEEFPHMLQDPEILKLFEPAEDPWGDEESGEDDDEPNDGARTKVSSIESLFKIPNKTAIKNYLVGLISRLYPNVNVENGDLEDTNELHEEDENSEPLPKKSFREVMDEAIRNPNPIPLIPNQKDLTSIINNELILFIKTKQKGIYLQKAYKALMTIKPTSVESERAFSVAGYLCTKVRNRFKPDTLSTLCFLRQTFRNQNAFPSS